MINVMLLIIGIGLSRIYFLIFGYFISKFYDIGEGIGITSLMLYLYLILAIPLILIILENQRIIKLRIII